MAEETLPRMLVVDDEAPLLRAIRETLPQHGYAVTTALTTEEALEHLQREQFEILLTDLQMAGMNGVALLTRALAIDPLLVGIVMTGHGSIDSAVAAMKAGAHDFILKPFKLSAALTVFTRGLASRQLRRENARLEQQLRARTEELEAINRELELFSSSVSHDLRAPLRSIEGFASLLREALGSNQPAEFVEYVERIDRATSRMNALIDDLLRFGRTARTPIEREEVDLAVLAREFAGRMQAVEPGRQVQWQIAALPPARGDPGLLGVVLENLLSNAWKFTRATPQPRIEVAADTSSDGAVVYWVRDNGIGFDPRRAKDLFTPFHRLHPTFEGTGIGLATVQRIVHRHGGRIWADAAVEHGATFFFTVPDRESPASAPAHPVSTARVGTG